MPLSQALQHLLKAELISLQDPPQTPNTSSLMYNPNRRYGYHSNSHGHDTNNCWALKRKIQDMINNREIEFDPLETPNVITALMPEHDKGISVIEDVLYITFVNDMLTPLSTIKNNLL